MALEATCRQQPNSFSKRCTRLGPAVSCSWELPRVDSTSGSTPSHEQEELGKNDSEVSLSFFKYADLNSLGAIWVCERFLQCVTSHHFAAIVIAAHDILRELASKYNNRLEGLRCRKVVWQVRYTEIPMIGLKAGGCLHWLIICIAIRVANRRHYNVSYNSRMTKDKYPKLPTVQFLSIQIFTRNGNGNS